MGPPLLERWLTPAGACIPFSCVFTAVGCFFSPKGGPDSIPTVSKTETLSTWLCGLLLRYVALGIYPVPFQPPRAAGGVGR